MNKTVVIVGNGISGITTARFLRKYSDCRIIVIGSESDYFYSRTALMYIYMGQMTYEHTKPYEDWFWEKNRIELVHAHVESISTNDRQLALGNGEVISYDVLVLATGAKVVRPDWPGINLRGVQGLYGLTDLSAMVHSTRSIKRGVVVGGGLIGIEMAEMLSSRGIDVSFLVRESSYMNYILPAAESELVNEEINEHGIDLRLSTEVAHFEGQHDDVVAVATNTGDRIECEFAGVAIGVTPNIGLAAASGISVERGVLVDEYFETSVAGVYAVGDCAEFLEEGIGHRPIEQLWYSGRRHGETVANTIAGSKTAYDKGVFFNSAKFFNLEYQTYGLVPPRDTEEIGSVFWQHPKERKLIRVSFRKQDQTVCGFNSIGIRFRQQTCERWILDRAPFDVVMSELGKANFDPEFSRRFEADAASVMNTVEHTI